MPYDMMELRQYKAVNTYPVCNNTNNMLRENILMHFEHWHYLS